MSVLVEFSMSPLDQGPSLSPFVARSLDIIDRSGIAYRLNPMGTVLEGEWETCMKLIGDCFERMKQDCRRITCSIKIDYRAGQTGRLDAKIASVERVLGRTLEKS